MDLNDLALALDLPKLSMERNIYAIQIKDNIIKLGASRNHFGANTIHIWYDNEVNIDFIHVKKPKYNRTTGEMERFSKKLTNFYCGDIQEAKKYLHECFKN